MLATLVLLVAARPHHAQRHHHAGTHPRGTGRDRGPLDRAPLDAIDTTRYKQKDDPFMDEHTSMQIAEIKRGYAQQQKATSELQREGKMRAAANLKGLDKAEGEARLVQDSFATIFKKLAKNKKRIEHEKSAVAARKLHKQAKSLHLLEGARSLLQESAPHKNPMVDAVANVHQAEDLLQALGDRERGKAARDTAMADSINGNSLLQVSEKKDDRQDAFSDMRAVQDGVSSLQAQAFAHVHQLTRELKTGVFPSSLLEEEPAAMQHHNGWRPMKEVEAHFKQTLAKLAALPAKHKAEDAAFIEKMHEKHLAWEARRKKNEEAADPLGIGEALRAEEPTDAPLLPASSLLEASPLADARAVAEGYRRKMHQADRKLHADVAAAGERQEKLNRDLHVIEQSPASLLQTDPVQDAAQDLLRAGGGSAEDPAMAGALAETPAKLAEMQRGLLRDADAFNEKRKETIAGVLHPSWVQLAELPDGDGNERLRAAQKNVQDLRVKMLQDREAGERQAGAFKQKAEAELAAFERRFGHRAKPGEPADPLADAPGVADDKDDVTDDDKDMTNDDKDLDRDIDVSSLLQASSTSEPPSPEEEVEKGHSRTAHVASLLGEYASELTSESKRLSHASLLQVPNLAEARGNMDAAVDKLRTVQNRIAAHTRMYEKKVEDDKAKVKQDLELARDHKDKFVAKYDRQQKASRRGRDMLGGTARSSLIEADPTYDQLSERIQQKEMSKALESGAFQSSDDFMAKETQLLDHAADPLKKFQAQLDARVSKIERGDPASLAEVQLRTH